MIFQVVSPIVATIDGNSFKEAVKEFVKLNYALNLTQLIVKDQMQHYNVNVKKMHNRVGISYFPINSNALVDYPVYNTVSDDKILPIIGTPISPLSPFSPFIPTVINIPT